MAMKDEGVNIVAFSIAKGAGYRVIGALFIRRLSNKA
jgi:hypothetical protein